MDLTRYDEPQDFWNAAEPFLMEHEAKNNLMIGIALRLCERGKAFYSEAGAAALLSLVTDNGSVLAAATMTPPHNLVLADGPSEALEVIARNIAELEVVIPGVLGPKESVETFLPVWKQLTGCDAVLQKAMRVYELTEVIPPVGVSGSFGVASLDQIDLITDWTGRFCREVDTLSPRDIPGLIQAGSAYIWRDPDPVSMAVLGASTPNGSRVGGVYTPQDHRGRGYASAVTAGVSQKILDSGRRFCYLFTDLANPTSNSIYQKIGYRPVCDFEEVRRADCPHW